MRIHVYDSNALAEVRRLLGKTDNPWNYHGRIAASIDYVKQDHVLPVLSRADPWDVIIFDEAHNLGTSRYGGKVNRTLRYRAAEELAPNGDDFAFWNLISLLARLLPLPLHNPHLLLRQPI